MRLALQIISWVAVVFGVLAVFGSFSSSDTSAGLLGGALFFAQGLVALMYINQVDKLTK